MMRAASEDEVGYNMDMFRLLRTFSLAPARLASAAILALASGLFTPTYASDTGIHCQDGLTTVSASEASVAIAACKAASAARTFMESCELKQIKPIAIREVAAIQHEKVSDNAFAIYDPRRHVIEILAPTGIAALLKRDPLTASFDPYQFLLSVAAHEYAHGIAFQHFVLDSATQRTGPSRVGLEYIAYVVQFSVMADAQRRHLLRTLDGRTTIDDSELNPVAYGLSPFVFGAKAYVHFHMPGHGCELFKRILSGHYSFPSVFLLRQKGLRQ